MAHTCHAIQCDIPVHPSRLMCPRHWRKVLGLLKTYVLTNYQPGQEVTKKTTKAYRRYAARAIIAVAEQEGVDVPPIYRRMAQGQEG